MSVLLDFIKFTTLNNWSVSHLLERKFQYNKDYKLEKIGSFLIRNKTKILVDDSTEYKRVKIKLYNKGVLLRDKEFGKNIGTKKQFIIKKGQFLLSKIDARNGAFGIATDEVHGAIITADFFAYDIDITKIEPYFLVLMTTTKKFQQFAQSASSGTTGRQRIDEKKFLDVKIPLPSLEIQKKIVKDYLNQINLYKSQIEEIKILNKKIRIYLFNKLGINIDEKKEQNNILSFIKYSKLIITWSYNDLFNLNYINSTYKLKPLNTITKIIMGNSPKSTSLNNLQKGYQFIGGASDIKNKQIISNRYIDSTSKLSAKGDILYLIRATIGKPFILNDSYYLGRGVAVIRTNEKQILRDYLINVLELFEDRILASGKGSTFKQISKPDLENLQIPLPSLEIQNKIIIHIKKVKEEIKELNEQSLKNKNSAFLQFEREIFNND